MKRIKQVRSLIVDAYARASAALSALLGRSAIKTAHSRTPKPPPSDPTKVLFPDEEGARGDRQYGGSPDGALSTLLEDSARKMVRRTVELNRQADDLIYGLYRRGEAEITLSAQALRVLIGLIWLGVASWLFYNGQRGDAGALPAGMSAADALVLSGTFFIVSAAGLGVAFGVAAIVALFGNGNNGRIQSLAAQLGQSMADSSRKFDDALTDIRDRIRDKEDAAGGIYDLTHAFSIVFETNYFSQGIRFLWDSGDGESPYQFRGFLRRESPQPPALPVFILGAIIGALTGALYVYAKYAPDAQSLAEGLAASATATSVAIAQYPWAANLLLLGAFLYAGMGALLSLASPLIAGPAVSKARDDALIAIRSEFTKSGGANPHDIIRRLEDLIAILHARVDSHRDGRGERHNGANHPAASNASYSAEDSEIPSWRRRDSSLTFVDAGFTTAPKEWRTDAFAKKFSAEDDRKPASKRGRLSFKKPPGR